MAVSSYKPQISNKGKLREMNTHKHRILNKNQDMETERNWEKLGDRLKAADSEQKPSHEK